MRPEVIATLVPAALAIILEVIPGIRDWWAAREKKWKPLYLLVGSMAIPFGAVAAACYGIDVGLGATCANPGDVQLWVNTGAIGFLAFLSTQASFALIAERLGNRLDAGISVIDVINTLGDEELKAFVVNATTEAGNRNIELPVG